MRSGGEMETLPIPNGIVHWASSRGALQCLFITRRADCVAFSTKHGRSTVSTTPNKSSRVYDHVDDKIPTPARMYERRFMGYSGIGYAIEKREGSIDEM